MYATFNIRVNIENDNVTTTFDTDRIEGMDPALLTALLKIFHNAENKVKSQMALYGLN